MYNVNLTFNGKTKTAYHNMSQKDAMNLAETLNRLNKEAAKFTGKVINSFFKAVKNV